MTTKDLPYWGQPDTRPTRPIIIDGVEHQIHIKTVLGEAGEYDLYDLAEVYVLLRTGPVYSDEYKCKSYLAWRWYRMWYQHGAGLYHKYKMAGFVFYGPPVPGITCTYRWYATEAGVYDYIGYVQNGDWENVAKYDYDSGWYGDDPDDSIGHPDVGPVNYLESGWVLGEIHSPSMDKQREQGATEEEIYQLCLQHFYGLEEFPPGVVLGG